MSRSNRNIFTLERAPLLVEIAQDFAKADRPSLKQINAFKELFYNLIQKSDHTQKVCLAHTLSKTPYLPRSIALYFVMDELEVSLPLLRYSPVLFEKDLISQALSVSTEHARAIAKRPDISPAIANALLSRPDENGMTIEALSRNETLKDNHAVSKIVTKARINRLPRMSHSNADFESSLPDMGMIQPDPSRDVSELVFNLGAKGGKLERYAFHTNNDGTRLTGNPNEERLLRCSQNHNPEAFAHTMHELCGLPNEVTRNALYQGNAGLIASMLKANDISSHLAAKILLLTAPDLGRNTDILRLVLDHYRDMQKTEAVSYLHSLGADFETTTRTTLKPFSQGAHADDINSASAINYELTKTRSSETRLLAQVS